MENGVGGPRRRTPGAGRPRSGVATAGGAGGVLQYAVRTGVASAVSDCARGDRARFGPAGSGRDRGLAQPLRKVRVAVVERQPAAPAARAGPDPARTGGHRPAVSGSGRCHPRRSRRARGTGGDLAAVDRRTRFHRLLSAADPGREFAAPVKAAHLGMMADLLLPPAARLLTRAFGCGYLLHAGVPMFDTAPAVRTTVVRSARVEIGRVVVQRARWVVPTAQVPVRTKGEPDAGYLLRIVEWLLAHDIPSRCFVRMNEALTGEGG